MQLSVLTGSTTDISAMLQFYFWEPIYYATADALKYEGKPGFLQKLAKQQGGLFYLLSQSVML